MSCCLLGCTRDRCEDLHIILATVNGVPITRSDLMMQATEAQMTGRIGLKESALLSELLWNENERQLQGLPGGSQLRESRRAAVRTFLAAERKGDFAGLPLNAEITRCGKIMLSQR